MSTPADSSVQLVINDGISQPVEQKKFQQLIGSLQYAVGGTRPYIAQAVNTTAKYCAAPTEQHMTAGKRIIRYLKKTKDLGIAYTRKPTLDLIGYSDADYAGDRDHCHSTSGNLFIEDIALDCIFMLMTPRSI